MSGLQRRVLLVGMTTKKQEVRFFACSELPGGEVTSTRVQRDIRKNVLFLAGQVR